MPGRTLSDRQKKKINRDRIKECVGKVVDAYHQELLKEPEARRGLCIIAEYHGVTKDTLARAVRGKQSIDAANQKSRNFLNPRKTSSQILFLTLPIEASRLHIVLSSPMQILSWQRELDIIIPQLGRSGSTHFSIETETNSRLTEANPSTCKGRKLLTWQP